MNQYRSERLDRERDVARMEPGAVPPYVDVVIYLYFATVAAIGRYLHERLWLGARSAVDRSDDGSVSRQNS